jgi:hypothetical protein
MVQLVAGSTCFVLASGTATLSMFMGSFTLFLSSFTILLFMILTCVFVSQFFFLFFFFFAFIKFWVEADIPSSFWNLKLLCFMEFECIHQFLGLRTVSFHLSHIIRNC